MDKQPVDHFDKTDTRTWMMRYCQNLEFYQPNGPIYLLIGGEAPLDYHYTLLGFIYELAKETNGALIMSEHRYYGQSLPFQNLVTENMKYLSSQQALADLATLVKFLKSTFKSKKSPDPKVVVVGGSYAGNLAAWMKLLYRDVVDAAISISGPVLAKLNFLEYFEIVGKDFLQYGTPGCYYTIKKIFKSYENMLSTPEGIEELITKENICNNTDMTKRENQQEFFGQKLGSLALTAQYATTIDAFKITCEKLVTNSKIEFFVDEKFQHQSCNDVDFYNSIKKINPNDKPWIYQTCTEFAFFQTLDSNNEPFTHNFPLEYYVEICKALFGSDFDEKRADEGVKATNALYGGRDPNVTKVVFVNGDLDPWHTLSVLKNLSDEAPAFLIPKSSHCAVMFSSNPHVDSIEMSKARQKIKSLIKSWIGL